MLKKYLATVSVVGSFAGTALSQRVKRMIYEPVKVWDYSINVDMNLLKLRGSYVA